ncbi:MAG: phosphoglucosamine mutase [Xanthomonadales bacterium]|nr:phosphoglucosamine mutase [Xanthomonadales bacterium]NIN59137.1 phosphoglucosamine mutase [Xanthomonadales bacterium]NIN74448.1 phosphoglucosamine mutase [Xanthomonadales bacterium]NIO13251.1 phosphoglucosamine mutase [Xanthomonadales bacterium]NIP11530.1 phosphoglucosamine mutase [Xanthomonadales bacterium]
MSRRYFGTDGVRGRVGDAPITADFILRLGRAAGVVLADGDDRAVVIGKDTRVSGYMFESALEAGLAAAGANVALLGPMPTPAVAYLTRTLYACAGIVISASHNPFYDNGVKFFSAEGEKLPDEVERAIEAELEQPFVTVDSEHMGRAERIEDAAGRYIEFCKGTLPFGTLFRDLQLVVDCANGSTYRVGPEVLRELGARIEVIGNQPNGLNINDDCGSTHPGGLQQAVVERGADAGIAFDGDGDRVIMVDAAGELVDGDDMLFIIARARQQAGQLSGGVVGTVMSNLGLEMALRQQDIPFRRAPVGDRYIHQALVESGWKLGGETSGHILCLDRTSTGDGIVSALQVLEVMTQTGASLAELRQAVHKFPQTMVNVPVAPGGGQDLETSERIQAARRSVEAELDGRGRVILRPSGTEPLVRVTLEGEDASQIERLAQELAAVVQEELSG